MKLADYVAAFLVKQGIKHVFVITGGASAHLIDSIARTRGIDYICPQHEQAGAMAADAYARVTGNLGAAIATSGPGATNMLTGVCCSFYDSIPVLYITGQVSTSRFKKNTGIRQMGFQETRGKDTKGELREEEMREKVMASLRDRFKPEFLNRIDEIIIFHPLSKAVVEKIVALQLTQLQKRLLEKNITLIPSKAVVTHFTTHGYDPLYGARPLKRVIQNEILDELALRIVEGKISEGERIKIDAKKGKIVFL